MRVFLAVLVSLILSACSGYKPAPEYAGEVFENPVIVKVKLDPEDPSSGVYLQDTIAQIAVNRLNLVVTKNANKAKNYIVVNDYAINTSPANYDKNGNVIRYSVNAAIKFAVKDKMGFWSKSIVTNEYVNVAAQTALGTAEKEKAARVAINKGLDSFIMAVIQRSKKFQKQKAEAKEKEKESEKVVTPVVKEETTPAESASDMNQTGNEVVKPIESDVSSESNSTQEESPIPTKEDKIFNAKDLKDPLAQLRE